MLYSVVSALTDGAKQVREKLLITSSDDTKSAEAVECSFLFNFVVLQNRLESDVWQFISVAY